MNQEIQDVILEIKNYNTDDLSKLKVVLLKELGERFEKKFGGKK